MPVFKCKMCGGTLKIEEGKAVAICEYCGSTQTITKSQDEIVQNLFNRANHLRLQCDFDKAQDVYEKILDIDDTDAEAHWGIVLCKYGIEYVKDPKTQKHIPTCHRAQYESILTDSDYLFAIENADQEQQSIYTKEAVEISKLQKDILKIVKNEKPFDIFICYKETDETGTRTKDSVIANDIYYELKEAGFKVFYAAITLEDKLGQEYEPYIFSALNSSKVMLVVGTKPEYFNAVWVKNEWARYLKLMKNDKSRTLIPCYRDMDAYDLPEEFSHLQAQDMSKIGFINDIVRGINKLLSSNKENLITEQSTSIQNNTEPLLERAFMFLEDKEFKSADEYCEKVLDINPKDATAYLGKLMVDLNISKRSQLKNNHEPFENNQNYQKALRFGDKKLINELKSYNEFIIKRNEQQRIDEMYNSAVNKMENSYTEEMYLDAAKRFNLLENYKNSVELAQKCKDAAKECVYKKAGDIISGNKPTLAYYESALKIYQKIKGYKDTEKIIQDIIEKIEIIKAEEKEKIERERIEKELKNKRRKKIIKTTTIISTPIICAVIVFVILLNTVILPSINYDKAIELYNKKDYYNSLNSFYKYPDYKDSNKYVKKNLNELNNIINSSISTGLYHTVGLKNDGTCIATGVNKNGQCNIQKWNNINKIFTGDFYTIGLKKDGTCVATGGNTEKQCNVQNWKDTVAISAGSYHTIGLKKDGTCVTTGDNDYGQCDIQDWKDIVAISAGSYHTIGLKKDGTCIATGNNEFGQCNIQNWKDIVAISAGNYHTIGLKKDGTCVATGSNQQGKCNIQDWKDIIVISAGGRQTVGLKSDGTCVATGNNDYGQCDVQDWKDIVAISASSYCTIGLKKDGTCIATGDNEFGQCNIQDWKDIGLNNK